MSRMKAFAEQVSIEMGYGGELNPETLAEAQRVLMTRTEDIETQGKVVQAIDSLRETMFIGSAVERADGRIELICVHGCGHPSAKLQEREWELIDGIHGCCGCCSHPSFAALEEELINNRS